MATTSNFKEGLSPYITQIQPESNPTFAYWYNETVRILDQQPTRKNQEDLLAKLASLPQRDALTEQLRLLVKKLGVFDQQLRLFFSGTLLQKIPDCFFLGQKLKIVKIQLVDLPHEDEKLQVWKLLSLWQSVQKVTLFSKVKHNDKIFSLLEQLPALRSLKLCREINLEQLPHLKLLTHLETLHFTMPIKNSLIPSFRQLPLKALRLDSIELSQAGFESLCSMTTLRRLALKITKSEDFNSNYKSISLLKKMETFQTTYLPKEELGFENLAHCLRLKELCLERLPESHNLRGISKLTGLRSLNLKDCAFNDLGMMEVAKLTNLSLLKIERCFQLKGDILKEIAQISHLKSLSLISCTKFKSGYRHLTALKTLQVLHLRHLTLKEESASLFQLPLKFLYLDECFGLDENSFAHLGNCTTLNVLFLHAVVSKTGLAKLIKLTKLHSLNLEGKQSFTLAEAHLYLTKMTSLRRLGFPGLIMNPEDLKLLGQIAPQIKPCAWVKNNLISYEKEKGYLSQKERVFS